MDSKGALSVQPARQSRLVAVLAGVWLSIILVLAAWWASIIVRQSQQIAELGIATGLSSAAVSAQLAGTHRMVFGELSFFMLLLLTLSGALFWFYRREILRARATQAFFAALTHELRTPLTSVRLQTEAIAEGEPNPELVERLLADTHRLESQIDKTLELARIEGGGSLAEQAIKLETWLERVLRSIAAIHGEQTQLEVTVEPALPPIRGDTAAVQMILRNLVENSVRHGDRDRVRIDVSARRSNNGIELRYRDNGRGPGDAPAKLGRLFQRGGSSSGTGVGLYLVRVLMDRMGGKVEFAQADGGGFEARLSFQPSADQV
ncbi:MAG: HAMP domain-containing sensor histidine kinase [Pseudomonadota bacterium]